MPTTNQSLSHGAIALLAAGLLSTSCARNEPAPVGKSEPVSSSLAPSVASNNASASAAPSATAPQEPARKDPNFWPRPPPAHPLENEPKPKGATLGRPVFSCGVANFAWRHVAYGHVLDDQGRIWFYDLGRPWYPKPAGDELFAGATLRERFKKPILQSRRVSSEELATMLKKARLAKDGRLEEKEKRRDAGSDSCEAYLWEGSDSYRSVELGGDGDVQIHNTSPEAEELSLWLRNDLALGFRSWVAKK